MPIYLLSSDGEAALAKYINTNTLFAFDIDGTLAPIVDDYMAAKVDESTTKALMRLSELAHIVIITGRSRDAGLSVLGFEPFLLIGNHGAEWPPAYNHQNANYASYSKKWMEQLNKNLSDFEWLEIEFKGESLSLHYRKSADPEKAAFILNTEIEKLDPKPLVIGGKFVINLLPIDAFTKGKALLKSMDIFKTKRAIYFGDDVTDEEVFKLNSVDLLGVHIGEELKTAAQYYLTKQSELLGVINYIAEILKKRVLRYHRFEEEN